MPKTFATGRIARQAPGTAFLYRRLPGYLLGFVLFYAPFTLWVSVLDRLLGDTAKPAIHSTCLRIQMLDVVQGKGLNLLTVWGLSFALVTGSALIAGPLFCGRLCAAGAVSEYLSRMVPDRFKVDWTRWVNPVGIRYGFLVGYLAAPFVGGSIACAFCSYAFLERISTGALWNAAGVLSSSAILTGFLWLGLFGVFAKGGRGYCTFMCPVGAWQSGLHAIGAKLPWTWKIRFDAEACTKCAVCVDDCPMRALRLPTGKTGPLAYDRHSCITCRQCVAVCKPGALSFSRGCDGWVNQAQGRTTADGAAGSRAPQPVLASEGTA